MKLARLQTIGVAMSLSLGSAFAIIFAVAAIHFAMIGRPVLLTPPVPAAAVGPVALASARD